MNFIFTGNGPEEEKEIKQKIHILGGFTLTGNFSSSCTHIVCFKYAATEKIMAGLAAGVWLVSKKFVEDSFEENKWLAEENYEMENQAFVAKYHRMRQKKLFSGRKIYVCSEVANYASYRRVFGAGGALCLSQNEVKYSNETADFAVCDKSACSAVDFLGPSTPIISLDYLQGTIFKKRDPNNFQPFIKTSSQTTSNVNKDEEVNEQSESKPSKATLMNLMVPPFSPAKTPRRRNKIPFTPKKYRSITDFFKLSSSQLPSSENDIEVLKEVKIASQSSLIPTKNSYLEPIEIQSSDSDVEVVKVISKGSSDAPTKTATDSNSFKDNSLNLEIEHTKEKASVQLDSPNKSSILESKQLGTSPSKVSIDLAPEKIAAQLPGNSENLRSEVFSSKNQTSSSKLGKTQKSWEALTQEEKLANFERNVHRLKKFPKAIIPLPTSSLRDIVRELRRRIYSSYSLLLKLDNLPYIPSGNLKAVELPIEETMIYNSSIGLNIFTTEAVKVGRHKRDILVPSKNLSALADDEFIAASTLDYLKLSIHEESYPNAKVLGELLKKQVLQSTFDGIVNKATMIFTRMLLLHPPRTTTLRDYYLNVFSHAAETQDSHGNKKWFFIKSAIEHSLTAVKNGSKIFILQKILPVFYQDLKFFKERPVSVRKLLSYRLFWDHPGQRPSLLNEHFKEFTVIWVQSAAYPPCVRNAVMDLFSVFMEVVWKEREREDTLFLSRWPMDESWMPIAGEIYNQFRGMEDHESLLRMISRCHVAWQRMLYNCLLLRATDSTFHNSHLSISTLKKLLENEAKNCPEKNSDSKVTLESHTFKYKLISNLLQDFMEGIGISFYLESIQNHLRYSLMQSKDIIHAHPSPRSSKDEKRTDKEPLRCKAANLPDSPMETKDPGSPLSASRDKGLSSSKRASSSSSRDARHRKSHKSSSKDRRHRSSSNKYTESLDSDEDLEEEEEPADAEDIRCFLSTLQNEYRKSVSLKEKIEKRPMCSHLTDFDL